MGQQCGCVKAEPNNEEDLGAGFKDANPDIIDEEPENEKDSNSRGYTAKKLEANVEEEMESPREEINPHAPNSTFARLIAETPPTNNPNSEHVLNQLGPYKYTEKHDKETEDLPFLGPYELENEAIYYGQWKKGLRHGKGRQQWKDGSIYEGYWKNNMASGLGRLIHADGDVYEGDWMDDKAHGRGTYTHLDGAMYDGDWYEDKQVKTHSWGKK